MVYGTPVRNEICSSCNGCFIHSIQSENDFDSQSEYEKRGDKSVLVFSSCSHNPFLYLAYYKACNPSSIMNSL
jgi:hypothetical protein